MTSGFSFSRHALLCDLLSAKDFYLEASLTSAGEAASLRFACTNQVEGEVYLLVPTSSSMSMHIVGALMPDGSDRCSCL